MNGSSNSWPFLYQGREKETSDPGPLYYSGGGQFYSPQLVRSLSEQGQTSSNGSGGGPSGRAISPPSGSSGGLSPQSVYNDTQQALQVGTDIYAGAWVLGLALGNPEVAIALAPPLAIIGGAVDFVVNFFEDIFGGGSSSETPRQLLSRRHPLYPKIIGVSEGLIPTERHRGSQNSAETLNPAARLPCGRKPLGIHNSRKVRSANRRAENSGNASGSWKQLQTFRKAWLSMRANLVLRSSAPWLVPVHSRWRFPKRSAKPGASITITRAASDEPR